MNDVPRQHYRNLTSQLLEAIAAWEDALTDEERDAQRNRAHVLLDRLVGEMA